MAAGLALTASRAPAQPMGPTPPPCADPCPSGLPVRGVNSPSQWYPDEPDPTKWADRRPTAEIRLRNGNYRDNDRGLMDFWWDATPEVEPITCLDTDVDQYESFNVQQNAFQPPGGNAPNGRPDQFDWLIAHLQDRYDRGYRRIVLFLPAGTVSCQKFPASQWWPMAQWRRDWFEAITLNGKLGIAGWIYNHPDVQMGLYMGWPIGNPCSLCMVENGGLTLCAQWICKGEVHIKYRCPTGLTTIAHMPDTTSAADMCVTYQNIAPWRAIGVQRFWLDGSAESAMNSSTELRQFAYNPALFNDSLAPLIFGGEAFPYVQNPHPPGKRYTIAWDEFAYMPFVISLELAESPELNGEPCPVTDPPEGHTWYLPTPASGRREAAIFPYSLPTCSDGSVHPDWDGIRNDPPYDEYPFERLENLYKWYICRGFTFWEGGASVHYSGYAERIFGFGKIEPAGDFNGDGFADAVDMVDFERQWTAWSNPACINPETHVLTYFHGDLNSDGLVNQTDWDYAHIGTPNHPNIPLIGNDAYPEFEWWLGHPVDHTMLWDPNLKWLPCGCDTGVTSLFGPP